MKTLNRALKLCGEDRVVGASATAITVLEYNVDNDIRRASGTTVPTDGDAGYEKGAFFMDTDAAAGSIIYLNEGTTASCAFTQGVVGDVTSVVAGAGMTGGGASGAVTLNVINTDGKITVGADTIDITAGSLVNADINAAAVIAWSKLATSANISTTGTVTGLTIASAADGDILYRAGGVWVRLAKGTANYFLKMNAGATAPEWSET